MYIIFNKDGEEFLRYFDKKMPEELKENEYIEIDEEDIPKKEGFNTLAKLVDGELKWEFVEIPKTKEEILQEKIKELDKVNKANMLALMEINSRLNKMESDK